MTRKGKTEERNITVSFSYDALGNIPAITDGESSTYHIDYDKVGSKYRVTLRKYYMVNKIVK